MLIDALDESERAPGSPSIFERLPEELPRGVYLIVSTRPAEEESSLARRGNVSWLRLDGAEFEEENVSDGLAFVTRELEQVVPEETLQEIIRVGAGNFLVLKLLCRHIRSSLRPDEVASFLGRLSTDGSRDHLGFIYEEFWRRLADRCGRDLLNLLCDVVGVLVSACAPLDCAVLCGVLGLRAGDWDLALRRLVEYLSVSQPTGAAEAVPAGASFDRLYHESFGDFVRAKVGNDSASPARPPHRLLPGLARLPGRLLRGPTAPRFAPTHTAASCRWDDLVTLLSDRAFLETKVQAGMVFDLADDFARAAAVLPPQPAHRRRLLVLEEALRGPALHRSPPDRPVPVPL